MSDRIDLGGRPWTAIPRELLRDERLSLKARGALVTLLSHDAGWVRSAIGILMREARCGRDAAKAAMAELREAGYAELVTERDLHGQLRRHYVIFAEPRRSPAGTSERPGDGKPIGRETHRTGNPANEVEALDVDPPDGEPKVKISTPRKRDAIADSLAVAEGADLPTDVPASRMRTLCVKANELRRLNPDVTADEVARRADNWASHFGDATITGPAIVTHWARLTRAGPGRQRREPLIDEMAREWGEGVNGDSGGRRSRVEVAGELPGRSP